MIDVTRLCFVNCGLPAEQCQCWQDIYGRLLANSAPLPTDFAKVWDDNVDKLYDA